MHDGSIGAGIGRTFERDQRLKQQVHRYLCRHPQERARLTPLLEQLEAGMDVLDRKSLPGHITASGIAFYAGKMLLVLHPYLKKWLQPGGHIETGEVALDAARREVLEETGLVTQLHEWHERHDMPFDIDIHGIPANAEKQESEHLHYDFRYLLRVDGTLDADSVGDHPTRWAHPQDIDEPHLKKLIVKLGHQGFLLAKA